MRKYTRIELGVKNFEGTWLPCIGGNRSPTNLIPLSRFFIFLADVANRQPAGAALVDQGEFRLVLNA
jgi:hypothetical protein